METTTQAAPQSGVVAGEGASKPEGLEVPTDEAGVASLLDKLNAPGGDKQAQEPAPAPAKEGEQPEVAIPDKFKNPDGTVNTEAMAKSYAEAEKQLSQMFQQRSEWQKTSEQLSEMQNYVKQIDEWRQQQMSQQEEEPEHEGGTYTPEEIEEMQKNPRSFIQKEVKKSLSSFQKEQEEERKLNEGINSAINYGRANIDGFKTLEPEIAKLMESPALAKHPDSVQIGYYATLGQKVPQLIAQSKNMGFTEGYNKAKEEMGKHVESGGKSSIPMSTGELTKEQIQGMSLEELEKALPTTDSRVQRDIRI